MASPTRAELIALRRARRVSRGPIRMASLPAGPGDERVRVLYAVPTRVGNAVARNRARRRLRELLRAEPLPPGLHLLSLGSDLSELDPEQLTDLLGKLRDAAARRAA